MPRNVVVTGGAAGIGRVIAEGFLGQGDQVHVCDIAADAVAAAGEFHARLRATRADVSSPAEVESLFREAREWMGPIDILVNNERLLRVLARIAEAQDTTVDNIREEALRFVSMRTMVEPSEICALALFLASDAASHITAQIIAVDGNIEWEQ